MAWSFSPAELGLPASHSPSPAGRRLAQQNRKTVFPTTPGDNRTFFEKLFGMPQSSGPVLAYAGPEGGVLTSSASPRYDRWTAVYDVAAHTVYLPNGTRLEAHSGLGDRLDDPRHVNERMLFFVKPREGHLSARLVSRDQDDPGAHLRKPFRGNLANPRGAAGNDHRSARSIRQ